ncbi:MAG TPA: hypothetical protein VFL86_28405 [Burkholderiaceae bacterium]|nr:hypothetical protein [Burkholderiaceae bacterium]
MFLERLRPAAAHAFLGRRAVGLSRAGQPMQWQALPMAADPIATLLQLAVQSQPRPRNLHLWLSGAFARPFVAGPLAGMRRWHEAQTVLAAMAPDATGLEGPCAVWTAGPVHREAAVVVAMPQALLDELSRQAKAQALRLRSVRPWWSAAFNAGLAQAPTARLLVLDDGEALTSLQGEGEAHNLTTSEAATQWPAPDEQQRAGWLARLMAGRNLAPPHTCTVRIGAGHPPPWQGLADVPFGAALQAGQTTEAQAA